MDIQTGSDFFCPKTNLDPTKNRRIRIRNPVLMTSYIRIHINIKRIQTFAKVLLCCSFSWFILDGNSEIGAHVRNKIGNLTYVGIWLD